MKTMNLIFICLFTFLGISCSPERTTIEQENLDRPTNKSIVQPQDSFLELHLHQYFLENELAALNEQRQNLMAEIETGNDENISALEAVQQEIERYQSYYDYNNQFIEIIDVPRVPPKPSPCENPGSENNCPVLIPNVLKILSHEEQGDIQVTLYSNGEVISELLNLGDSENYEGLMSYQIATDFSGEAVLEIKKYDNVMENVTYKYFLNVIVE